MQRANEILLNALRAAIQVRIRFIMVLAGAGGPIKTGGAPAWLVQKAAANAEMRGLNNCNDDVGNEAAETFKCMETRGKATYTDGSDKDFDDTGRDEKDR